MLLKLSDATIVPVPAGALAGTVIIVVKLPEIFVDAVTTALGASAPGAVKEIIAVTLGAKLLPFTVTVVLTPCEPLVGATLRVGAVTVKAKGLDVVIAPVAWIKAWPGIAFEGTDRFVSKAPVPSAVVVLDMRVTPSGCWKETVITSDGV
jgi:hypothetical protein